MSFDVGAWCDTLLQDHEAEVASHGRGVWTVPALPSASQLPRPSRVSAVHPGLASAGISSSSSVPSVPDSMSRPWWLNINDDDVEAHAAKYGISPEAFRDKVYLQWVPQIAGVYRPLTSGRSFRRKVRAACMYNGCWPERRVHELFGIPTHWLFTMDKKDSAIAFCLDNYADQADHHFTNAMDFVEHCVDGECLWHNGRCGMSTDAGFLDVLYVSTSCKPYSMARVGRRSGGTTDHDDSSCVAAFLKVLVTLEPKCVLFEQVFGFALRESSQDPRSPLSKMLDEIRAKAPDYQIMVFFARGSTHMILDRHRVYICMVHNRHGGARSLFGVKKFVKANSYSVLIRYSSRFIPRYYF